jgi:hypothetical protein
MGMPAMFADFCHLQSNSGSACTCVVTEYHYHNSGNFKVEINFFTETEIMSQIQDLLQSYRNYHLRKDSFSTQESDEKEDCKQRAQVAVDTFRSMFGGRLRNESTLLKATEDEALNILRKLVYDCMPSSSPKTQTRPNLDECSKLIAQITSETSEKGSANEPTMWPYIQNIRHVETK